jgi:hypothetical protein
MEMHRVRLDKEICGEPSAVYGVAHGIMPRHFPIRYVLFFYHVDREKMGFGFVE